MKRSLASGSGLAHRRRTFALASFDNTLAAKLRGCSGRGFVILSLALPLLLPSALALPQAVGATGPSHRTTRGYKHLSLDERVQTLAKNLALSEAQQSAVKKILEERQQETLRIRLDPSMTGSARIDRFRALQEKTVEAIRAVLNEEQKKKYDPLAVRKLPPAPQQRSVDDWLKATAPH
jgi:hypothetical protein